MLNINGKNYPTISNAASEFGVSVKAIREWIKKKIISPPPQIDHGARAIDYFPPEYMQKAKAELKKYRERKKQKPKDQTSLGVK